MSTSSQGDDLHVRMSAGGSLSPYSDLALFHRADHIGAFALVSGTGVEPVQLRFMILRPGHVVIASLTLPRMMPGFPGDLFLPICEKSLFIPAFKFLLFSLLHKQQEYHMGISDHTFPTAQVLL